MSLNFDASSLELIIKLNGVTFVLLFVLFSIDKALLIIYSFGSKFNPTLLTLLSA